MTNRRSFVQASAVILLTVSLEKGARPAGRPHRIGFLGVTSGSTPGALRRIDAFRAGLRALGYVEGTDVVVEFRWADGDADRLAGLARELILLPVDVLVTQGSSGTRAAKDATSTIPIVMMAVGDAIGAGLVASLARPGGNVTGSTFLGPQIYAKQLELLKQADPRSTRIAVLMNPDNPSNRTVLHELEVAARSMKLTLTPIPARGQRDLEGAFHAMTAQHFDGVVVSADALLTANSTTIAELALTHRLPTASAWWEFAESGGLLVYGANIYDLYSRSLRFVDKIFKGAKPADLPVEQPTKFDFVINLKTAKALGLTIPPSLLVRADEVIQ